MNYSILIIILTWFVTASLVHAQSATVFYVAIHPNTGENYVLGTRGERQPHAICVAPKDPQGNQVVHIEELDIAPDNCRFNASKRALRLAAEVSRRDAHELKSDNRNDAAERLSIADIDTATLEELRAIVKDLHVLHGR